MIETAEPKTATVADALDLLVAGGVDLVRELSNPWAAWRDVVDELETAGYSDVSFNEHDLLAAIAERLNAA
jgi:hypothetical protein